MSSAELEETKIELPIDTVVLPQSLVAPQKEHPKRDKCIAKLLDSFYDILTILISIADVTTDLMVLVSFYHSNRMTFFWISFTILIIAQIGYLIVFFFSFDVEPFIDKFVNNVCECKCCALCDNCCDKCCDCIDHSCQKCDVCCDKCWSWCPDIDSDNNLFCKLCNKCVEGISILLALILIIICAVSLFCILLPFGHLVSFLMYFSENDQSRFSKWLSNTFGIKKRTNIPLEDQWSDMAKFTAKKINKHGGFILEAFLEALPQSILQLIAMVYFKETDVVAVCSILLSMTSIMTKSLVISQGLEWRSFVFTWLSVITDFFSIFFVVSWLFLSNEYVNGDFLGHFSIIGEFWCWKVTIAIIVPIAFIGIAYVCVAMWLLLYGIIKSNLGEKFWFQALMVLVFLTLGNAALAVVYCVVAVILFFLAEIVCFGIISGFIWLICTAERWSYTQKKTTDIINKLLYFIGGASYRNNDRIIRILCVNYAYDPNNALAKYILERKREETLHTVTYKDIRNHSKNSKFANFFTTAIHTYCNILCDFKKQCIDDFDSTQMFDSIVFVLWYIAGMLVLYITLPIYLLSRIATVLYPYFIVGYLVYYDLWFKMHPFELSMLAFYILLQCVLVILGFFMIRTHKWLWHIVPGDACVNKWDDNIIPFLKTCYSFYDSIQWLPVTRDILCRKFGKDIGMIIVVYLKM